MRKVWGEKGTQFYKWFVHTPTIGNCEVAKVKAPTISRGLNPEERFPLFPTNWEKL
jgi:hypothetical protein